MADSNSSTTPPPTICSHCAGPLSKEMETSKWTLAPLVRDSFSMIGSAVGGTASAFYGFNHGGAVPALAQLVSSSVHAAMSSSPSQSNNTIQKSRTSIKAVDFMFLKLYRHYLKFKIMESAPKTPEEMVFAAAKSCCRPVGINKSLKVRKQKGRIGPAHLNSAVVQFVAPFKIHIGL